MTDRELLELAAKAAGVKLRPFRVKPANGETDGFIGYMTGPEWARRWFDPLTDDGDALRLAVKVGMEFAADDEATHCAFAYARVRGAGDSHVFEPIVDDPCKAMRRAIVRAAAALAAEAR